MDPCDANATIQRSERIAKRQLICTITNDDLSIMGIAITEVLNFKLPIYKQINTHIMVSHAKPEETYARLNLFTRV